MALKRGNPNATDDATQVFASSTIEDRKSTFIAHYSPSLSAKTLQASPDFRTASHRISAWRKASNQQTLNDKKKIFTCGSDDDGEKYAGKRVERVLNDLQVEGAVVVARWYGGVLLGPARFTHIENVAKEAVAAWRATTDETSAKKRKVEDQNADEEVERKRLTKQLTDRDQSITVLRQLLAEKQSPPKRDTDAGEADKLVPASPFQIVDYAEMSIVRLRQLDKARDATISWILKQIDQAEAIRTKPETAAQTDTAAT
jgi:putative IMPACT (imprinted ancient) family translation regulator